MVPNRRSRRRLGSRETADLSPVSGGVLVRTPGAPVFLPLEYPGLGPLGALVNARAGKVAVGTASASGGRQTITLSRGEFKISQGLSGAATATLAGGSLTSCRRGAVVRELLAEGPGHGSYAVNGALAIGVGYGARWLTQDRCGALSFVFSAAKSWSRIGEPGGE